MFGSPGRRRTWLAALLVVPLAAAFLLGLGQVGLALGAATAAIIVVLAVRARAEEPIEVAERSAKTPGGVLVLALTAIEDAETVGLVAAMADPSREQAAGGVLVLSPARGTRLDRWADDLERARFESQRVLAVSVASLAAAGVEAEGRVGDGDPLQAAEDTLRSYPATEVVIVAAAGDSEAPIAALQRRLALPSRRIVPMPSG